MAVLKYQSSKTIITKVFRDLRIQDADWITDSVEWIGESLQGIGSIAQLEQAIKVIKTSSHKAKMPDNLYQIDEVRYGYYNANKTNDKPPKREDFSHIMPYESSSIHPALIDTYNTQKGAKQYCEETFFIRNNMINTSFEEDWVAIVYKRIAVDSDGFPMVPDHYSFSQALYWYIVMKMLEGGMKHPAGSNQINWVVAEDRWQHYCTQARTKALMPDPSKYREFARSWVSLIPQINENDVADMASDYEEPRSFKSVAYSPIKE